MNVLLEKFRGWCADFFLKAMSGVALLLIGQLYGVVPTVQPIMELSEEDELALADFGSDATKENLKGVKEKRWKQIVEDRKNKKKG